MAAIDYAFLRCRFRLIIFAADIIFYAMLLLDTLF